MCLDGEVAADRSASGDAPGDDEPDWPRLIVAASAGTLDPVRAREHVESLMSASQPQKIRGEDRRLYAVKFLTNPYGNGRAIFAEQLVPLLGQLVGAPVPEVAGMYVSGEFVAVSTFRIGATPPTEGLHHASAWVDNCSDRQTIAYVDENRELLGALSVLYTWAYCTGDHQLIYRDNAPHSVLSVDHSAFFGDQGTWTPASLSMQPAPAAYDSFFDPAGLTDIDRSQSLDMLESVTPHDIARAVARPPDTWGVSQPDRAALADFLYMRQAQVLALSGRVRT